MEAPISQVVYDAGQRIARSPATLGESLNEALNQILPWPFRATEGRVRDADGQETDRFGTVIHTAVDKAQTTAGPCLLEADHVACVIDAVRTLDVETLRSTYDRIARVKRLRKAPLPDSPGVPCTTVTLGLIFSHEATVPLQRLAEELDTLNRLHDDREWIDMVAVLTTGTINYAVQFPGEGLAGDWHPPAAGALAKYAPPIYVIIVARLTGGFTFNKLCSFLLGHLMFFSPGTRLPNWNGLLDGAPEGALILGGYQYNVSGRLLPVPPEFYNDRYIPPRPFLIVAQSGELLATVQFLPWQDGGVVRVAGNLPLAALLIFLGKDLGDRGGVVNLAATQISYVLPIDGTDFQNMLRRVQAQSNLVVKSDPTQLVVQKIMDEGTRSPFIARLYFGVLRLAHMGLADEALPLALTERYAPLIEALLSAREMSRRIVQLLDGHIGDLASGTVGRLHGQTIHIEKGIDNELRNCANTFINSAVRALKQGMQGVTKCLEKDIGFLFKKQSGFEDGAEHLKVCDRHLAEYLEDVRRWSEPLVRARNDIEHEGWRLPPVKYTLASGKLCALEPEVLGQRVSDFVRFMLERLACFAEEVTVHCLATRMPQEITVVEIPLCQREADMPLRFRLALREKGVASWTLAIHEGGFEET